MKFQIFSIIDCTDGGDRRYLGGYCRGIESEIEAFEQRSGRNEN